MDQNPTLEQVHELHAQIRNRKISRSDLQNLLDGDHKAFLYVTLREIIDDIRPMIATLCKEEDKLATLVSLAGITRDIQDVERARGSVKLAKTKSVRAVNLINLARITKSPYDAQELYKYSLIENAFYWTSHGKARAVEALVECLELKKARKIANTMQGPTDKARAFTAIYSYSLKDKDLEIANVAAGKMYEYDEYSIDVLFKLAKLTKNSDFVEMIRSIGHESYVPRTEAYSISSALRVDATLKVKLDYKGLEELQAIMVGNTERWADEIFLEIVQILLEDGRIGEARDQTLQIRNPRILIKAWASIAADSHGDSDLTKAYKAIRNTRNKKFLTGNSLLDSWLSIATTSLKPGDFKEASRVAHSLDSHELLSGLLKVANALSRAIGNEHSLL